MLDGFLNFFRRRRSAEDGHEMVWEETDDPFIQRRVRKLKGSSARATQPPRSVQKTAVPSPVSVVLEQLERYVEVLGKRRTADPTVQLLVCRDRQLGCTRLITAGLHVAPLRPESKVSTELMLSFEQTTIPEWALDVLSKASGRTLVEKRGGSCPYPGHLLQRPVSMPAPFRDLYGPSGQFWVQALYLCHPKELSIETEPIQILNHLYHHGVDDIVRTAPRPDLGTQELAFSQRCLLEARNRLVAGDVRSALSGLARAGQYLEQIGQPDKARALYQIAQARGANAGAALHRLGASGVSTHAEFYQRVDFFLNHGSMDLWYAPEPRRASP